MNNAGLTSAVDDGEGEPGEGIGSQEGLAGDTAPGERAPGESTPIHLLEGPEDVDVMGISVGDAERDKSGLLS